ncbi:hypothetical protein NA56DRAFT_707923 [Hyaloscypha hepaticicola]|uniref:Uncharacterized protein n=1 Tax=Hyaloscypha hepaticicola TaxID=2082293 RepID=A0A2J6PTQ5_9HELO|nr:hypothetical protein NA56DRAFT_707923 [Hyaloscypha hepaticicola]
MLPLYRLPRSWEFGDGQPPLQVETMSQSQSAVPFPSICMSRPPPSQQRPLVLNVAEGPPHHTQTRLVVISPCCPMKKGPATEAEAMMWRVAPAGEIFIVDLDNTIEAAVFSSHLSLVCSGNRVGTTLAWNWVEASSTIRSYLPPSSPGTIQTLIAALTPTTTTASEIRLLICKAILWTGQDRPILHLQANISTNGAPSYNSFN